MLKTLRIQNLAVVEDVTLSFEDGLNVLTGSTGAGKSLILSAVNYLLGERANAQSIRAGEEKALVEGVFRVDQPLVNSFLLTASSSGEVRLRREVHKNGRSYAYVGEKSCTVKQLQEISRQLIEPHGQNEQLRLKDSENHVVYLDKFASNEAVLGRYADELESFQEAAGRLKAFDDRIALLKEKKELIEHRLDELERAKIVPREKDKLEESIRVLENANDVFEALAEAEQIVYENEESAITLISRARNRIERLGGLNSKFESFTRNLGEAEVSLKETVGEMRAYLDGFEFEPGELERKQERLASLIGLERRYQMSIDELCEEAERWRSELESIEFEDEERAKLRSEKNKRLNRLRKVAMELRDKRREAARRLDKRMTGELEKLMMPGARFRTDLSVEVDPASDLVIEKQRVRIHLYGVDQVEFYVQTNPGENEGPLCEVASSGELSRIALALKEVVSSGREGSLLVFDELDAGVGADLGEMISRKLRALGERYQIICITHMPQIAAKAEHHFVVRKTTTKGRTFTRVAGAEGDERLSEIARMLGGKEGSEKRLALAREMLQKKSSKTTRQVRP
ncbi:MAG: DNA repair protein RecN [Candidatus Latescibacterota bacterium]|nr:MAG: DNA repair protein RecN [Candidatus Latescibacterota bacterium]